MVGCSVVIFSNNSVVESYYYGKSDLINDLNIDENVKYRVASISKTVTAIAVLQLVEKGFINLDRDISQYLGFKVHNSDFPEHVITTRMLLSHTSGITDGTTFQNFLQATIHNINIPDLREILTAGGVFYSSSNFGNYAPGSYFRYSNLNYVILGTLIEKISNVRFDIYCRQNIFSPLGIDASFNISDIKDFKSIAVLYRKSYDKWVPQIDNLQTGFPDLFNVQYYKTGTNAGRFCPQGGLRCSANDIAKIFMCLMNKNMKSNLLLPDTIKLMLTEHWIYNGKNGDFYHGLFQCWGLGVHIIKSTENQDVVFRTDKRLFGHRGEAYGLVGDVFFDIDKEIGFVFITNGVEKFQQSTNSKFYKIEQQVFNAIETSFRL